MIAHRAITSTVSGRDKWGAVGPEGEAGDDGGEGQEGGFRRGKTMAAVASGVLLEENRRLYMDNLRLWDCLTLIRGDPALTCQGAINLVFSLGDEDYLCAFPDTNHLFLLRFPHGVVYHNNREEAKSENFRLKDENARLHAAVWVLRDNPTLQADSTVAAIFRLDESQFQFKFHVDLETMNLGSVKSHDCPQYQNNNKARRRSYRASLDMGNEVNLAIHLTNRPLKVGYTSRRSRSLSDRAQKGTAYSPVLNTRKRSGSVVQQKDFTSNRKPTSPKDRERIVGLPGEDEFIERLSCCVSPSFSCEPRHRQNSCFGSLYQCAAKEASPNDGHAKTGEKSDGESDTIGQEEERTDSLDLTLSSTDTNINLGPSTTSIGGRSGGQQFGRSSGLYAADSGTLITCTPFAQRESNVSVSTEPPGGTEWRATTFSSASLEKMAAAYAILPAGSATRLLEPSKRHQREVASNPLLLCYNSVFLPPGEVDFCANNNLCTKRCAALAVRDFRLLNTSSNNENSLVNLQGSIKKALPSNTGNITGMHYVHSTRSENVNGNSSCRPEGPISNIASSNICPSSDVPVINTGTHNDKSHNEVEHKATIVSKSSPAVQEPGDANLSNKGSKNQNATSNLEATCSRATTSTVRSQRPRSAKSRSLSMARRCNLLTNIEPHIQPHYFPPTHVHFETEDDANPQRMAILSQTGPSVFYCPTTSSHRISCFQTGQPLFDPEDRLDRRQLRNEESPPLTQGDAAGTPVIYLSSKPSVRRPVHDIHQPYRFRTYTWVKHYLERHRRVQEELAAKHRGDITRSHYPTGVSPSATQADLKNPYFRWRESMQGFASDLRPARQAPPVPPDYARINKQRKPKEPSIVAAAAGTPTLQTGKLKGCDSIPPCGNRAKLRELKRMGRFQFTKPLAAMIRRNNCRQWQPIAGTNCQAAAAKLAADVASLREKSGRGER